MEKQHGQKILKKEYVISTGKPYEGRKYLRNIFNESIKSILIRDNYLKPIVLDILEEFVTANPNLEIRLLIKENQIKKDFLASFQAFKDQYEGKIFCRYNSGNNDHPRYIIIDNQQIFNPDHSLDQWGYKTVNVHLLEDELEKKKIIENLNDEWEEFIEIEK